MSTYVPDQTVSVCSICCCLCNRARRQAICHLISSSYGGSNVLVTYACMEACIYTHVQTNTHEHTCTYADAHTRTRAHAHTTHCLPPFLSFSSHLGSVHLMVPLVQYQVYPYCSYNGNHSHMKQQPHPLYTILTLHHLAGVSSYENSHSEHPE